MELKGNPLKTVSSPCSSDKERQQNSSASFDEKRDTNAMLRAADFSYSIKKILSMS